MCDQLAGDEVDAGIALKRTAGQLRQLEVILSWEVLSDLAYLVLHDMMVVAEPVLGPDRLSVLAGSDREEQIRLVETGCAAVELREQRTRASRIRRERVRDRDACGVRFELVGSEKFRGESARLKERRGHAGQLSSIGLLIAECRLPGTVERVRAL